MLAGGCVAGGNCSYAGGAADIFLFHQVLKKKKVPPYRGGWQDFWGRLGGCGLFLGGWQAVGRYLGLRLFFWGIP